MDERLAGPEEVVVGEVPEMERSAEGRAEKHWNLFTSSTPTKTSMQITPSATTVTAVKN